MTQHEYQLSKNIPSAQTAIKSQMDPRCQSLAPSPQPSKCNQQDKTVMLVQEIERLNYKLRSVDQYVIELNHINQQYQEAIRDRDSALQQVDILQNQLSMKTIELHQIKEREASSNQVVEFQRRSQMDSQIRELTAKFNTDKSNLEAQIRTLNYTKIDLENKCALMAQENERLNFKMTDQMTDFDHLKSKLLLLENDKQKLYTEIIQLKQQSNQLQNITNEQQLNQDQHEKDRVRILMLCVEIERLWLIIQESDSLHKKKISDMDSELKSTRCDFQTLQTQNSTQLNIITSLENRANLLTKELERTSHLLKEYENRSLNGHLELEALTRQVQQFKNEKNELLDSLSQLEGQSNHYENQAVLLSTDNERLRKLIEDKLREIEYLRLQVDESNTLCDQLKSDLALTNSELSSLQNQYRIRINEYQLQSENQIAEINKSQQRFQECCKERDFYIQQSKQLQQAHSQLEGAYSDKEQDMLSLQEQINLITLRHQSQIDELRQQSEFSKRSLLDSQIRELTNKFNHDKAILDAQLKTVTQSKIQLENQLTLISTENQRLISRITQLESDYKQLQAYSNQSVSEKELQIQIYEQSQVTDRTRILLLSTEIERLWIIITQLEDKIKLTSQEALNAQQMNERNYSKIAELESLYQASQEQNQFMKVAQQEKESQLMNEIEELYQQIEEIQRTDLEVSDLEARFRAERTSWETMKLQLNNQIREYELRCQQLEREMQKYAKTAEDRMREIEEWKNRQNNFEEFDQLKQENHELMSQISDLEQLNIKLKSQIQLQDKQLILAQDQVRDKQQELEDYVQLMTKQRRQSEHTNREADTNRKNQIQLQNQIQNLEGRLIQANEQIAAFDNDNNHLKQRINLLENALADRDHLILQKTTELNDKIFLIDQMKDKYQNRLSSQSSSTIRTTTQYSRRVEQENQFQSELIKSKGTSVPPKPSDPRKAMAQIDYNFG